MKVNLRAYITLAAFLLVMLFFFANQVTPIVKDAAYNENKKKAEVPVFDVNHLDAYPSDFEAYLGDNFSLRGYFLKEMGKLNTRLWNKSPKPDKLIIGKDKWLFNVDKELDFYNGKQNFTQNQLEAVLAEFDFRKKILDSMGIEMLMVINPTKYSIYPEYLPNYLVNNSNNNAATQLVDFFNKNASFKVVYTKDYLMAHKKKHRLYFKGDNHWNQIGAYYAAQGILSQVKTKKPVRKVPFNSFCIDTVYNKKGNLAHMAADADVYLEESYSFSLCENDAPVSDRFVYEPIEGFPYPWEYQRSYCSNNATLPNALIIRDSYGSALVPFLKNAFNNSTFIFDAWHYDFNLEIIEQEKPDIVLFMILESLLPNLVPASTKK